MPLGLNDSLRVGLRPERANHACSCHCVSVAPHDGRLLHLLTLIDEYTRERLAI